MPRGVTVALVVIAAVLVGAGVLLLVRVRALLRRLGSFVCSIRTPSGWSSGVAHYGTDRLSWYKVISLAPRPRFVWPRDGLVVLGPAREIDGPDAPGGPGAFPHSRSGSQLVEVSFAVGGDEVVLGMSAGSYAGLASWLESAPPGAGMNRPGG